MTMGSESDDERASGRIRATADTAAAHLKATADAAAAELAEVAEGMTRRLEVVAGLANEVRDLNASMERLNAQDEINQHQLKRNKVVNKVLLSGLLVFAVLIAGMGFAINGNMDTSQKLKESVAVQNQTINDVLCPLYSIFLDSYNPKLQPPSHLAVYEAQFAVIRHSYVILKCVPARPAPTASPTP